MLSVEGLALVQRSRRSSAVWVLIISALLAISSLGFVPIGDSIVTRGVLRADTDRVPIIAEESGTIARVLAREGERSEAGAVVLVLDDTHLDRRREYLEKRREERMRTQSDLRRLIAVASGADVRVSRGDAAAVHEPLEDDQLEGLELEASRQEYAKFASELMRLIHVRSRAWSKHARISRLSVPRLVSDHELELAAFERRQTELEVRSFLDNSAFEWEKRVSDARRDVLNIEEELAVLARKVAAHTVRAPVSGMASGMVGFVPGRVVQAGETIGYIVPSDGLLVELSLSPAEISAVELGQHARVFIDVPPPLPPPMIEGMVSSIAQSASPAGPAPGGFRVLVQPSSLSRVPIDAMRGATVSARLIQPRRSPFQILLDRCRRRFASTGSGPAVMTGAQGGISR